MQASPYCTLALVDRYGDRRGEAIVDRASCQVLAPYRWWLDTKGYARRSLPGGGNVQMHREIMHLVRGDGRMVDHINGRTLDNRRANLRVVDNRTNRLNLTSYRGASSIFRGVYWDAQRSRWRARVRVDGQRWSLGTYRDEIEAADAVEQWRKAHGPCGWERDPNLPRQEF